MESDKSEKRKRSLSTSVDEETDSKRFKAPTRELLSLSDDVLFLIFKYLSTADLFEVSRTCVRLSNIASDKSFWRIVDTSLTPFSIIDFRKLLKFFNEKTSKIVIGGFLNHRNRMHHESVTPAILESICQRCPKLESFELKHCFVDATKIKLCLLPKPIKHLGIIDCEVINVNTKESYFFNMHTFLPELESVDLSNSPWLCNHSIQAIGKNEKLLRANLKGCYRIGECFVYTALATRFGFRRLKWLDVRDTSIGDSEVTCFGRLPNIRHLLLGHTTSEPFSPPQDSEGQGIITDRGVSAICPVQGDPHVSKLEHLVLTHTCITEKSMDRLLKGIPSLKSLDLRGSKIDDEVFLATSLLRPNCEVIYKSEN